MDSFYLHLAPKRALIIYCYYLFVVAVVAISAGFAINDTYGLDFSDEDTNAELLVFLIGFLLLHWVTLYGTGPLREQGLWFRLDRFLLMGPLGRWPRLVAVGRWFWVLPGLALQLAVQLVAIAFCYLALSARVSDGVVAERNLTQGFLGEIGLAVTLVVPIFFLALLVLGIIAFKQPRLRALFAVHAIVAIVSLYGALVLAATLYLDMAVFRGGQNELVWSLAIPVFQLTLSTGSLLRLCFGKTEPAVCVATPPVLLPSVEGFSGSSSLSSARVLATAMLAISYVAIDVSLEMAGDMGRLEHARGLAAAMSALDLEAADPTDTHEPGAPVRALLRPPMGTVSFAQSSSSGWFSWRSEIIKVVTPDGRVWMAKPAEVTLPRDTPESVQLTDADKRKHFLGRLEAIAKPLGIEPDAKNEDFYRLFVEVERKLATEKQVSIPLVGLEVGAGQAAWFLTVVAFLIQVLIRSRTRRVFADARLALEEPWLILDGRTRSERLAAYGWLLVLTTTALITHIGVLVVMGAQIPAEGGLTSEWEDASRFVATLTLFVISTWIAVDTARHLLTLRRLRALASAPEQAKAAG